MFSPGAWAVLVLKNMNLKRSQESCFEEPQVGEDEGFYNRMLWPIPEDEEDSANKGRKPIQLTKKRSSHHGRDCNCNKKNGNKTEQQLMVKPRFSSPIKQMRRNARVADAEVDYKVMKSTDDKYPFQLSLMPPRKKADEDELSNQCEEISQIYLAMSQGKLTLENLRMLGLLRL
ncbi:hypothetical protein R1flu_012538 [Riccia fluitans]|uniref:Uncharacterized protein n=1 Tax=Riccia fluitans TaxID=41844 RepID=A0ABD1ZB16_9MARC